MASAHYVRATPPHDTCSLLSPFTRFVDETVKREKKRSRRPPPSLGSGGSIPDLLLTSSADSVALVADVLMRCPRQQRLRVVRDQAWRGWGELSRIDALDAMLLF